MGRRNVRLSNVSNVACRWSKLRDRSRGCQGRSRAMTVEMDDWTCDRSGGRPTEWVRRRRMVSDFAICFEITLR